MEITIPQEVEESPALLARLQGVPFEKLATIRDIETEDEFTWAIEQGQICAALVREIKNEYDDSVALANALHKNLTTKRGNRLRPVEAAVKWLGQKCAGWQDKKQREAREVAAEQERKQRAALDEAALHQSARLEEAGRPEEAREILQLADAVQVSTPPAAKPKAEGFKSKDVWTWEWVDATKMKPEHLCKPCDPTTCEAVKKRINGIVATDHTSAEQAVGGIRVFQTKKSGGFTK